ncbi:hypothetical protein [Nesterenkonia alba]|uniref:hypothetical protein n=1 Tax=Nesterenkonia alba TaxID=515814 RepID=UPI0003B6D430|nr:hypothetical protein [Nesterenkonia alba]
MHAAPEGPVGTFITEQVLPFWDELNEFPLVRSHMRFVLSQLERRGFSVTGFRNIGRVFMHSNRVAGGSFGRLTTLVSDQAAEAAESKWLSRQYFTAAGLPVPTGELFTRDQYDDAARYASSATVPLVLKSDHARHAQGMTFGITGAESFQQPWEAAVHAGQEHAHSEGEVLLEEFLEALTVRFFIIGSAPRAATVRVPLFVVGDGRRSIRALLQASFDHRRRNRALELSIPEITEELVEGADLNAVPARDELRILSRAPAVLRGALPVDVTETISQDLTQLAVDAAAAIPGLTVTAVDVLTPDLDSADEAVVLDVDPRASLRMHRYPAVGTRRLLPGAIADQIRLRARFADRPRETGLLDWDEPE